MGRLPYQVLAVLYLQDKSNIRYCVFGRNNPKGQFQFIAGGGEGNETPIQAVVREVFEESGADNAEFQPLTSLCYIPTNIFPKEHREAWGENIFVIPEYSFGVAIKSDHIQLSEEHIGFRWATYDEALSLLKWDSNKTALYELNSKLTMAKSYNS
ncbi:MAG: NUDIX pyrophosphatase [Oscillospiraceae bacterium]|nr:NUDIX pyrophosphatase [Oscillospiraceae bacterium]